MHAILSIVSSSVFALSLPLAERAMRCTAQNACSAGVGYLLEM
jgi:hypothetical protein